MRWLSINFSPVAEGLDETRRLEVCLAQLGEIIPRPKGDAPFSLRLWTHLTCKQVQEELDALSLEGNVICGEQEHGEMAPA